MKYVFTVIAVAILSLSTIAQTYKQFGASINGESAGDYLGNSVSLSSDGSIVAIGAPTNDAGYVRIYKDVDGVWTQLGSDIDGEADNDLFGYSVSLSNDGSVVAIGAPCNDGAGDNAGHVRIYEYESGAWVQIGSDLDGPTADDNFGYSVSLSGDATTVAIGAPHAHGDYAEGGQVQVYENESGTWSIIGSTFKGGLGTKNLGASVSLSYDGTILAIGAPDLSTNLSTNKGLIEIHQNTSSSWTHLRTIYGDEEDDKFGYSVSLSADGSAVAVGAPQNDDGASNGGLVRIYQNNSGTWSKRGIDLKGYGANDKIGCSVCLSSDGSHIAIGAPYEEVLGDKLGQVRIYGFDASGAINNYYERFYGSDDGDKLGVSVSLNRDGSVLVLGGSGVNANGVNSGEASVYTTKNIVTFVDHDKDTLSMQMVYTNSGASAPTDPTRIGYTFTGWDMDFSNITSDTTVTAEYDIATYNVVFNDYYDDELKKEVVNYGASATAPTAPELTGYTFSGWDKDFSNVKSDLIVTAEYVTATYIVVFEDHDGKELKRETVEYMNAATAPNNPTRTGYTFTGWDTFFSIVMSDLTVTAEYSPISYTVIFEDHDGFELGSETVNHGSAATAPADPVRTGYTFTGWDIDFSNVISDLKVTAEYTAATYTVVFEDHDGKELKKETVNHGSAATAPADPTRTGYKFTGWDNAFDNITTDLTVTAQYEIVISIESKEDNSLSIYPNPAVNIITIKGVAGESVEIYSQQGVLLNEIETVSGAQTISVADLPQGIYIIKVRNITERLSIVR